MSVSLSLFLPLSLFLSLSLGEEEEGAWVRELVEAVAGRRKSEGERRGGGRRSGRFEKRVEVYGASVCCCGSICRRSQTRHTRLNEE
eukprot:408844-Rhodomonas_salina.1